MTKIEAIEAMQFGNKVTHRFFTKDEYIYMDYNLIHTEDGCSLTVEEFFKWRVLPAWDYDWEIWHEPTMGESGIELIAQERKEQIEKHKISLTHDRQFINEELVRAAIYTLEPSDDNHHKIGTNGVGWGLFVTKIKRKDRISQLKIAGALIAAEIDRILSTNRVM